MVRTVLAGTAAAFLLSCTQPEHEMPATWKDDSLAADLRAVASMRIFFGHQSVGGNIVSGLRELAELHPDVELRIVDLEKARDINGPMFAESLIGTNSDPGSKCAAFEDAMARFEPSPPDIALMKFCYVDIKHSTNVDSVFERYARGVEELKLRYPATTFVHLTIPTTQRTSALKQLAKKILGKVDTWDVAATNRYQYNMMLRSRFGSEPLFDIDAIESRGPDGEALTFEYQGRPATELYQTYTDDGGHLNEYGRRVVARELVRYLARVASQRGAASSL